jgi:hypothetical protein
MLASVTDLAVLVSMLTSQAKPSRPSPGSRQVGGDPIGTSLLGGED